MFILIFDSVLERLIKKVENKIVRNERHQERNTNHIDNIQAKAPISKEHTVKNIHRRLLNLHLAKLVLFRESRREVKKRAYLWKPEQEIRHHALNNHHN